MAAPKFSKTAIRQAVSLGSRSLQAVGLHQRFRQFAVRHLASGVLAGNFNASTIQRWIAEEVDRDIARAVASEGPILVGPWLMETGFELLYWIPFLRRAFRRHGVDRDRVIAISRGGTDAWYRDIAATYVDVFDLMDRQGFLDLTNELEALNDGKKPFAPCPPETDLIARAAAQAGIGAHTAIYPASMYKMFRQAWNMRLGGEPLLPFLDIEPFSERPPRPALPFEGPYVAAKFYFSGCFEPTEENRAFVRNKLLALAGTRQVVLLNTGMELDDHKDVATLDHPNIFDASVLWSERNNLEIQTAIVAHAERFYGTYGGFSYLAPLLGVNSEAVFSEPNFIGTHLDLAMRTLVFPTAGLSIMPRSAA